MDTRHMRYFVALAETLHFGHAAQRMNMSQPPFSRQISAIEKTLGVQLFERNSRNVALTPAGQHFLADCRAVLEGFDAACRDVQLVASGMKGELKLGFMMHAAHSVIPTLVRLYSRARPDVRLILEERIPTDIEEMLTEGKLDAAVTFSGGPAPHLRTLLLARDRLCLIVPSDHPLAEAETIGPQSLSGEKLIAAPASVAPTLRSAIGLYCADGGVIPHFAFEPRLQHTIIRLVQEGLGVALIPQSLCDDLAEGVISRRLDDAPEFDVVLCAPRAARNPAVPQLFEIAGHTGSDGNKAG
ncbi:DNA-binding transcriptional LysR family regulator [Rhizobium sp. BK512]|uniref:LysR family transcriptional regulator n=1 Tax=Rhizobium sp. BK512 TaxID=2587010 RepID=UPI00161AF3F4|nr:LysR substrate-binding domain-containing protein [Rhizobium sp. BK512]MBB3558830.1 DNA-binding transcriptional LysR family regulator [Rhizobium sp. BK512]